MLVNLGFEIETIDYEEYDNALNDAIDSCEFVFEKPLHIELADGVEAAQGMFVRSIERYDVSGIFGSFLCGSSYYHSRVVPVRLSAFGVAGTVPTERRNGWWGCVFRGSGHFANPNSIIDGVVAISAQAHIVILLHGLGSQRMLTSNDGKSLIVRRHLALLFGAPAIMLHTFFLPCSPNIK